MCTKPKSFYVVSPVDWLCNKTNTCFSKCAKDNARSPNNIFPTSLWPIHRARSREAQRNTVKPTVAAHRFTPHPGGSRSQAVLGRHRLLASFKSDQGLREFAGQNGPRPGKREGERWDKTMRRYDEMKQNEMIEWQREVRWYHDMAWWY